MSSEKILKMSKDLIRLKYLTKITFKAHCKTGLFTLKFHLPDYVVDDVKKFGSLNIFSASSLKQSHVHMKNVYRCRPQKRQSRPEETVSVLENS